MLPYQCARVIPHSWKVRRTECMGSALIDGLETDGDGDAGRDWLCDVGE